MKAALLTVVSLLTVSVWGSLIYLVYPADDATQIGLPQPLRADAAADREISLDTERNHVSDSNLERTADPDQSNEAGDAPEIEKGDALGHGDGISIDELLEEGKID